MHHDSLSVLYFDSVVVQGLEIFSSRGLTRVTGSLPQPQLQPRLSDHHDAYEVITSPEAEAVCPLGECIPSDAIAAHSWKCGDVRTLLHRAFDSSTETEEDMGDPGERCCALRLRS